MKKPQWATVIGIIGIMLGCFGLTEAVQTLAKPRLLLLQNGIVQHMHMNGEERGSGSEEKVHRESNIQHVPPWFKTWCTASGLTALIISGFYLFTAIRLFQLKPGALQLFIPAVVLSLCFAFIKVTVMLSITIFAGSPLLTGLIIGAVINLLLLTLAANTEQQVLSAPASASNKLHAVTLSATAGPQKPYRHRTHAADKTGTSACG